MSNEDQTQWVTMSEAARLLRVSLSKISRLAKRGRIETRNNPRDERERLVNLVELRVLFPD